MFVGKQIILGWLNNALQLRMERIEDVSLQTRRQAARQCRLAPSASHRLPPRPSALVLCVVLLHALLVSEEGARCF